MTQQPIYFAMLLEKQICRCCGVVGVVGDAAIGLKEDAGVGRISG